VRVFIFSIVTVRYVTKLQFHKMMEIFCNYDNSHVWMPMPGSMPICGLSAGAARASGRSTTVH
jgi:hypothetical protein